MQRYDVSVGGNIAVGRGPFIKAAVDPKTETNRILLQAFPKNDGRFTVGYYPNAPDRALLNAYYTRRERHALATQLHFLDQRLETHKIAKHHLGMVLYSRTPHEDRRVFGEAMKNMNILSEIDHARYIAEWDKQAGHISLPKLFVYFKASSKKIMNRIMDKHMRGNWDPDDPKKCELKIPPWYIRKMNDFYDHYTGDIKDKTAVVVINTEYADMHSSSFHEYVARRIVEEIRTRGIQPHHPGLSDWLIIQEDQVARDRKSEIERELRDLLQREQKIITLAGNIGLGKTTISELLQDFGIGCIYEDPNKNPKLQSFIAAKVAYEKEAIKHPGLRREELHEMHHIKPLLHTLQERCYELQVAFIKTRAEHRRQAKLTGRSFVEDRSPPEDFLAFCRNFHKDGYLTTEQLASLEDLCMKTTSEMDSADLMVVLHGPPRRAMGGIERRGRTWELLGGWTMENIIDLGSFYGTFPTDVANYTTMSGDSYVFHEGPVKVFNVGELNIKPDTRHTGFFLEEILMALR
ncbi:deoxynucleoside kinase [Nanoarchaeota archaeon]